MLDSILGAIVGIVASAEGMAGGNEAEAEAARAQAEATKARVKLALYMVGGVVLIAVFFFAYKASKK